MPVRQRDGARSRAISLALVVIVLLALVAGARSSGQQAQPLPAALKEGFRLLDAQQLDQAFAQFDDVRARAVAAHDPRSEAAAHRGIGRVHIERKELDKALAELAEGVRLAEIAGDRLEVGHAHTSRGVVFANQADWLHMEEANQSAVAAFGDAGAFRDQAAALRSLTGSPRLPWEDRERLIERAAQVLARAPDPTTEGLVLHRWGDILFNQGRYGLALEKLRQALPLLQSPNDRESLARLLTSIGRTYRIHGMTDEAIAQYRAALRIQTAIGALYGAAQSVNAIGVALDRSGRHREALDQFARALALAERNGSETQVALFRANLASSYLDNGQPSRALPLLVLGPNPNRVDEELRLENLSRAHRMLGRTTAALADADRAMAAARELGDPEKVASALSTRAEAHLASSQLDAAYADHAEALAVVERMRTNLAEGDRFKQNFSDTTRSLFTSAIRVLTRLGRHAEALEVAEKARGRALLDLLASRDVTDESGVDVRRAEHERLSAAAPLLQDAMRASIATLHSTLLAYWVASDGAHVWLMGADGVVHGRRLSITESRLRTLIGALASAKGTGATEGKDDPARLLYDALIKPVEAWLPTRPGSLLTIVPHGPLFGLPFAALRDAEGRYLVGRYATHYVTSLSVLDQMSVHSSTPATGGVLLVADPVVDPRRMARDGLAPLKGARAEVAAIARVLGSEPAHTLTGAGATVAAVRGAAASSRILHFATHAVVTDAGPLDSFLALSAADGDDGRLTSAEIYTWKLDADLVVLSACRTARGRITGDGVIGLSRAFAFAGAPSLVATVWDTPDLTASRLLPSFYAAWRRTRDRAGALRTAQLELIKNLRAGSVVVPTAAGPVTLRERPGLWAPFVLLGAR